MRGVIILLAGLWAAALPGCVRTTTLDPAPAAAPGRINHVVFFTLEEGADEADRNELILDSLELGRIPGVVACYAGTHIDTGRDTVLSDYDVGFFVAFDSEEDYAAYLRHPDHEALVAKWRPRLAELRVYDVLDVRAGQ